MSASVMPAAMGMHPATRLLNKVPEVTLAFWVIKILATTVGETGADFLSVTLGLGLNGTSVVMAALLAAILWQQLRADRYVPVTYWTTTVLVSVVGTLITDNMVDNLGVPLPVAAAGFAVALAAIFVAWYARERTLSIHTIFTRRREGFYWAAILLTFALGTAAGDLAAERMALGYGLSGLMFAAMIATVTLAYFSLRAGAVTCFWIAYILTRPFGASLGDLLAQAPADGGLGLGTIWTSAVFLVVIAALVVRMTQASRATIGRDR